VVLWGGIFGDKPECTVESVGKEPALPALSAIQVEGRRPCKDVKSGRKPKMVKAFFISWLNRKCGKQTHGVYQQFFQWVTTILAAILTSNCADCHGPITNTDLLVGWEGKHEFGN
jgi:hypothetical protein